LIEFSKLVASGNDFIVIDNRKRNFKNLKKLALTLCERRKNIGADGMLFIEKAKDYDFKMRIFNPDGSEAEMCGNGSRCIAYYCYKKRIAGERMRFLTKAGDINAWVKKDSLVKVNLTQPRDYREVILKIKGKNKKLYYIDTGVPHTVLFFNNVDNIDVNKLGKFIRYHKKFKPRGTNVDFVKILSGNKIKIRTYERGVEKETLSCGTGSVAGAYISYILGKVRETVFVKTKDEILKVYIKGEKQVFLEGKVKWVYNGIANI